MAYKVTSIYKNSKKDVGRFADFIESLNFSDITEMFPTATEAQFLEVRDRMATFSRDTQTPGNTLGISGFISHEIDETQLPAQRTSTYIFEDETAFNAWLAWWNAQGADSTFAKCIAPCTDFELGAFREAEGANNGYGATSLGQFLTYHFQASNGMVITTIHEVI
jgi:hypothetical protein